MSPKNFNIIKALMCQPTFFRVENQINPWMKPGSVNKAVATKQWQALKKAYQELGIKVKSIAPNKSLPDMVFTADSGIIKKHQIILSSFRYHQRQAETNKYKKWYLHNHFKPFTPPPGIFLEGGDCLWLNQSLLLGYGFRTSFKAARYIKQILNVEVIPLKLIDKYFYHLDTCLFVLNQNTAFYYPKAFSAKSQKILNKHIPNLIPASTKEVKNFCLNSITTDHHVITTPNNPNFKHQLKTLNYQIKEINISEFIKSGGGIHCLTQTLTKSVN